MSDMAQGREGLIRRLAALFLATFTISATANSGYAIIAVMRDDFVNKRGWFTEDEMNDYIAIVQTCWDRLPRCFGSLFRPSR